jgi:hypothetical protein
MILETASIKAIRYACMNFHYAKSIPVNTFGYSVFNDKKEWCGVILYAMGANKNLPKMFNLQQGQVVELVRMALNGKQGITTKCMALSMKLIKKKLPLAKLIVSYADGGQNHLGIIYQASNWFYTGDSKLDSLIVNGEIKHRKTVFSKYKCNSVEKLNKMGIKAERANCEVKRRYIYPLTKEIIPLCKSMSKPYPKQACEVNQDKHSTSSTEIGGSNPTHTL